MKFENRQMVECSRNVDNRARTGVVRLLCDNGVNEEARESDELNKFRHNPFYALSGILLRIPPRTVAASHDPGNIIRVLAAESTGVKLHGLIDNG